MENNSLETGEKKPDQQVPPSQDQGSFGQPKKSWTEEYYLAVKSGLQRIWLNRQLWFWGLFFPAGLGLNFNYGGFGDENSSESKDLEGALEQFNSFVSEYMIWIVLGAVIFLVIVLLFWVVSGIARSGAIKAIDELQNPTKPVVFSFGDVWKKGKTNFGQILLVDFFVGVSLVLIMLILAMPVVFLVFQSQFAFAVGLAILALLIYIPLVFLGYFLKTVGVIFCALSKTTAFRAIELAYGYFKTDFGETLKIILAVFIVGFLQGIVMFLGIFLLGVVVLVLALFFSLVLGFGEIFGGGNMAMVVFLVGLFAFLVIVWALFARALSSLWIEDVWIWWTKRVGGIYEEREKEKKFALESEMKREVFTGVE